MSKWKCALSDGGRGSTSRISPNASKAQPDGIRTASGLLVRAFETYESLGLVDEAAKVAEYPIVLVPEEGGGVRLVGRALALVEPDTRSAGRLLSTYGRTLYFATADYEGAKGAFGRALVIARREEDASLEMRTLAYWSTVDVYQLRWRDAEKRATEATRIAHALGDAGVGARARFDAAFAAAAIGESTALSLHAQACLDESERLRDHFWTGSALWMSAIASYLAGRWDEARESLRKGLGVRPRDPRLLSLAARLDFEVGSPDAGSKHVALLLEAMRQAPPGATWEFSTPALLLPVLGLLGDGGSDLRTAEFAARTVLSSSAATPQLVQEARTGLALIALQRSDVRVAQEQYVAMEPSAGTLVVTCAVSVDRILGLVSQGLGDLDKALEHLEAAMDLCHPSEYLPEYAWSASALVDVLAARGATGDKARAEGLIEECVAIVDQVGMHAVRERLSGARDRVAAMPARARAFPAGLTPREVEVLRIVASGKSNPEIATELFISLNTVTRHITNIFSKTDTISRAQAAVWAADHGLLL